MRSIALRVLIAVLAAAAVTVGVQAPAAAGSDCQEIPGLIHPDLCVSVQADSSSVQPAATAGYLVAVSSTGTVLDVTVSLTASTGSATFTSSCIVGSGTSHCWIATMGFLGSPTDDQMDAEVPAGSAGSSLTLTATASVPTLVSWTPPSASASVAVVAPAAPAPPSPSTPSSTASSPAGAPSSGTGSGGSTSTGTGTETGTAGVSSVRPGKITGTVGARRGGITSGAGTAAGLFPSISPSPSPAARVATARAEPVADTGISIAPIALGIGLALTVAWIALAAPGLFRRKRKAG